MLVGRRCEGVTSSSFTVILATPLNLLGLWSCHVESVYLSYANSTLLPGHIPSPVFIVCDFVETTIVNDTSVRILSLFSLEPDTEKGFKSVGYHLPRRQSVRVVKDYISSIKIDILDQRLREIPENFFRSDIVIELTFVNNV